MAPRLHTVSGGTLRVLSGGVPTFGKPSPPRNTTVTGGDGVATLTFEPPLTDGGSPITGYRLTATPPSGAPITATFAAADRAGTLTGLVNSLDWAVTVRAVTAQGDGTPSAPFVVRPSFSGAIVRPTAADTGCGIPRDQLTPISGSAIDTATKGANPKRDWTGYLVTGGARVWASDVTFTDCIFESAVPGTRAGYYLLMAQLRTRVQHCTFDGMGSVAGGSIDVAVRCGPDGVLHRCDIAGTTDCVALPASGQITENYIHGVVAPAGAHSDGMQIFGTINGLYVARNNIDVSDGQGGVNAAWQFGTFPASATIDNLVIEDNWLNGGGYVVSGGWANPTGPGVIIRRNRFGLVNGYASVVHSASAARWLTPTNVWDVTGATTGTGRQVTAGEPIS